MSRDPGLERRLLEAIVREARWLHRLDATAYPAAVGVRLELGAQRFGDDAFLESDNLAELLEETPDVAAHALLELQRLRAAAELDAATTEHLLRAAVHGAAADHHARRSVEALGGSQ